MNFGFGISNVAFVERPRGGRSFSQSAHGRRGASSSTVRDPLVVISGYPFVEFQIRRLQQRLLPLNHKSKIRNSGFTLTELLVVIALMVFLMILAWPALGLFTASTRLEGAVNGVSVAAQVMRVLNGQSRPHLDSPAHNGTAMVLLVNSSGVVEIHWTMNTGLTTGANPKNIYNDLDPQRTPVKLPNGMSVAGIAQPGASKLLDSPFAVRFNQYGQVMPGLITSVASASNPVLVRYQNTTDMSCVLGLVVYVKDQAITANLLDTAGAIKSTTTIDDLRLKAQGRVIFFNRYSGAASIEGVR